MRISRRLCIAVADTLTGSHQTIEARFRSAGVRSIPPDLPHHTKWKEWLFQVGQDSSHDSLEVLGNLIEEFMDFRPCEADVGFPLYTQRRENVESALEDSGLRYFRAGRILPNGVTETETTSNTVGSEATNIPTKIEELLEVVVKGLERSMHPLTHRRKGAVCLSFASEYDVQDLLHVLLRPWVRDIRPEEFTPSYAGSNTRMDFLLYAHNLVIETKIVRDRPHAKKIGDELIIDIEHYRQHPKCTALWCVIYDPNKFVTNSEGLKNDLEGDRVTNNRSLKVRVFVL